ncbi:beta-2-glycoprotein 1 [Emydura macquarii macquarii]|uniref:beta-2-glycoprotein 1 n=1 Tax=Emydura macquarii macquarii TaxID=1129001 RepID=UPI00352B1355
MYPTVLFLCAVSLAVGALGEHVCPQPPNVPFAEVDIDKRVYERGEEITYSCVPGYSHHSGSRKYTCPWSGKWPLATMRCIPKKCPYPGSLNNGKVHFTDLSYQSLISFSCEPGYILYGTNTSQCMADGQWSKTVPECQPVTCPPPSIPELGVISYHKLSPGNVSVFQDLIRFECLSTFALFGNETATCMASGNWSDIPECKFVQCPHPTGIENGFINIAVRRTYHYMETVDYGCHHPYVLDGPRESRCEKTSSWSIKPTCKAPCKIPVKRATVLYNGQKIKVQNDLKEGIQHTETISFFCKNKEKQCGYPVPTQCIDGHLTVPSCFKEIGSFQSFWKTDPADMRPCDA